MSDFWNGYWRGFATAIIGYIAVSVGLAHASQNDVWTCDNYGQCSGGGQWTPISGTPILGDGQATAPRSVPWQGSNPVVLPAARTACKEGWVLVDVAGANSRTVQKCAPVGDLEDPQ